MRYKRDTQEFLKVFFLYKKHIYIAFLISFIVIDSVKFLLV